MTASPTLSPEPVLRARGVYKRYGSVVALRGADLDVFPGKCVALIGDNGAGKSTLVKVLSGAIQPDNGTLLFEGTPVSFRTPIEARRAGIETVYQTLALAGTLDAATNIFLGRELTRTGLLGRLGVVDRRAMRSRTSELMGALNLTVKSLTSPVNAFSGGQRQGVAIARAMAWGQKVLVLDEPTAALGAQQTRVVMELIQRIKNEHDTLGVVLISHDLPRVLEVADIIVVLRHGKVAGTFTSNTATEHQLVSTMMGGGAS